MSSEIFYTRGFIKVNEFIIPVANHGASNCFDISHSGREIPERYWSVLNYPHKEKILHTREEMESVARIYEEANTRNRGGTRISRNRAFDVGEFGRWIRKGVHISKTVEEYVSWGNQIFVIDYADDWKLYPARTTQELLDTLRRFEGSPDIGVIFGDKRKLYRPKKAKGWHS